MLILAVLLLPKMAKRQTENRSWAGGRQNICLHVKTELLVMWTQRGHDSKTPESRGEERSLVSQQTVFKKKASFTVAAEIAKSARPFNKGEFVKKGLMQVCDLVSPEKKKAFTNVSLSRNTEADQTCDLTTICMTS